MIKLKFPLVLGSQSPRRKQILSDAGFEFSCISPDVEETYPDGLSGVEIPIFLAEKKAKKVHEMLKQNSIVVTSDTIVWQNEMALNKPETKKEAFEMLKKLSNTTHEVHTGVCVSFENDFNCFSDTTTVYFDHLSDQMIEYYVEKYTPLDKAGAYGIQEWLGLVGVEKIEGSFFNVMGFPINKVYHALMKFCQ